MKYKEGDIVELQRSTYMYDKGDCFVVRDIVEQSAYPYKTKQINGKHRGAKDQWLKSLEDYSFLVEGDK